MNSKSLKRENSENVKENLEGHIDRLNKALALAMIDLENSHSRVSSRLSLLPQEPEARAESPSLMSEDINFPYEFEQKIEELLLSSDRSQMVIEDFISEQFRKEIKNQNCCHDLSQIRLEIEVKLRKQKNELIEKERKNFEEKLESLDRLQEDYIRKKEELSSILDKVKEKELFLLEKEKELRSSRMAFDRHRMIWEQEHPADPDMPKIKPPKVFSSFNPLRSSLPVFNSTQNKELSPDSALKLNGAPPSVPTLDSCQTELKAKQSELESLKQNPKSDTSRLEMQIDALKNKIATIRGEQVILMSNQATRILNNIVESMQKQNIREEKNSKKVEQKEIREVFKIKQLEVRMPDNLETKRRFLFSDAPTPKGVSTPRTCEKQDPYKVFFENKKKLVQEKENALAKKENLLQGVFREILAKYPEARDVIDNLKSQY